MIRNPVVVRKENIRLFIRWQKRYLKKPINKQNAKKN